MTITRNITTGLILAVSFLVAANAKADMASADLASYYDFTYALSTDSTNGWSYAAIVQTGVNNSNSAWISGTSNISYVNPVRNETTRLYTNTGTSWKTIENRLVWDKLNWKDTVQGTNTTWGASDGSGGKIAGTTAEHWVAASGSSGSNAANSSLNGFYAYKYTIQASDTDAALFNGVSGVLGLSIMADDYLAGIYVSNGDGTYKSIYEDYIYVGQSVQTHWLYELPELAFDDVSLTDGALELIFIIHNTDSARSGSALKDNNASGLMVSGWFNTNVQFNLEEIPTNLTPEPATLALFGLGLAGLGLTRIRRRK